MGCVAKDGYVRRSKDIYKSCCFCVHGMKGLDHNFPKRWHCQHGQEHPQYMGIGVAQFATCNHFAIRPEDLEDC